MDEGMMRSANGKPKHVHPKQSPNTPSVMMQLKIAATGNSCRVTRCAVWVRHQIRIPLLAIQREFLAALRAGPAQRCLAFEGRAFHGRLRLGLLPLVSSCSLRCSHSATAKPASCLWLLLRSLECWASWMASSSSMDAEMVVFIIFCSREHCGLFRR